MQERFKQGPMATPSSPHLVGVAGLEWVSHATEARSNGLGCW